MSIVLEKGSKINLSKENRQLGKININLNWNSGTQKGIFSSLFGSKAIDLDLGCLYELKDGKIGTVQALGNSFGSFDRAPYIFLDGDDRTGTNADGENLFINGNQIKDIKRILVYTFIYKGAASWKEANGKVCINVPRQEEILINMDEYNNKYIMCALAMIENVNDNNFSVEKLVRFFDGHKSMDKAYNWGLKWVAGRK
ncbi:tellurium resistance protein [Clostridium saccharobutylicum]|uniref:TerD family protein n=1 Tax=Clostridium saccharobutylicum TaxID=169679 RepID=UPI000983C78A|nr:TerD family protein [Clostridium saccharobutylicum]AQS08577.1 tellurium resistance protein [Clostridium saccharobutylicum]MBC2436049.1 Tellurium resistance [Clostridium saccharobutylicum]NSB87823.1 tellurite resistance protein TerA [Clostridium saccharobutylicum]NYC29083.1 tellurite resistance protein TerA [Clostridium saccharobutylicum]OOM13280.1 tellurium resistance protein [Clostridium saccharobutylicum]